MAGADVKLERRMADRYDELYRGFRWDIPARYNIARDCCNGRDKLRNN